MAKRAFIFPGQASQYVGMGKDLFEKYPIARQIFQQANSILGFDIAKICFEGPEDELKQTRVTQPAIFVHSFIVHQLLRDKNLAANFVAGHSLGEYSALVAAGALSFENGLNAVKTRGELMQQAGEEHPGAMAAIIGLSDNVIGKICEAASNAGIVQPANFNAPSQVVISGTVDGVRQAMEIAREKGAKKVIPLVVSGAFHSPLMEPAQKKLGQALQSILFQDAQIPVYANVTASSTQNADEIKELLFKQLTYPVRWVETIQNLLANGVHEFYEIGPGKVLSGLGKRIDRQMVYKNIGTVEEIEAL